jgi:hypothetical protein
MPVAPRRGGSIVCDPEGTVIGDLPTAEPGVLRVALDLDADTGARARHRRLQPDVAQMAPDDPVIDLRRWVLSVDQAAAIILRKKSCAVGHGATTARLRSYRRMCWLLGAWRRRGSSR